MMSNINELDLFGNDENIEPKFGWDQDYEREILALCLCDRSFLLQSQSLIKPFYFTNEIHQIIFRILSNHWGKYKVLPSKIQLMNELESSISGKPKDIQIYYLGELNTVYEFYVPGLDTREQYRDKITEFAKEQALQTAFKNCLDIIKKHPEGMWGKIRNIVNDALMIESDFDLGEEYFQTYEERYERMKKKVEAKEIFTSGFPSIDKNLAFGGLERGQMVSWIALSGTGKSLSCVRAAVSNLLLGKKVLYISLEIDQDGIAGRFDAQLGDPSNQHGLSINNLYEKKDIVFSSLKEHVEDKDDPRMLVVKQFPGGSMDVNMFRAYHAQCVLRGFRPDLIIIDYIGEMKDYPGIPTWESRYRIVRDLRGFAVEEKVLIMTAMQPEKRARDIINEGGLIDDNNLADAYGQIRPLDALWSINQISDEKDAGLGRIFAIKTRHGKSRFEFHVEYNKDTLAITEISKAKYEEKLLKFRNEKELRTSDILRKNAEDAAFFKATKSKNINKIGDIFKNDIGNQDN